MSSYRGKTANRAKQRQRRAKRGAPQSDLSPDLSDALQRIQQAPKTATSADVLMLQRTLGNRATQQMLRTDIQREGDSEEEGEQLSTVDLWERALQGYEQDAIDLKAALKDGNYGEANAILTKLLKVKAIINAETDIKTGIGTNLKMLKTVITGRGQGTRMDRLRILDINNRYIKLAKEFDRLAKKYHRIPQLYEAIGAYLHARQTGETIVEQNL